MIFKKRIGLCLRNADALEAFEITHFLLLRFLFLKKILAWFYLFFFVVAVALESIFGLKTDIVVQLKVFVNRHCSGLSSLFSRK